MTDREQINIILKCVKKCTTWDQLQILAKHHGGIREIRMAINERACEITD